MFNLKRRDVRDLALFLGGMAGVFHETVIWTGDERLGLLGVFLVMMGLPVWGRADDARNGKDAA